MQTQYEAHLHRSIHTAHSLHTESTALILPSRRCICAVCLTLPHLCHRFHAAVIMSPLLCHCSHAAALVQQSHAAAFMVPHSRLRMHTSACTPYLCCAFTLPQLCCTPLSRRGIGAAALSPPNRCSHSRAAAFWLQHSRGRSHAAAISTSHLRFRSHAAAFTLQLSRDSSAGGRGLLEEHLPRLSKTPAGRYPGGRGRAGGIFWRGRGGAVFEISYSEIKLINDLLDEYQRRENISTSIYVKCDNMYQLKVCSKIFW